MDCHSIAFEPFAKMGDARYADWDSYKRANYGYFDFKVPGDSITTMFPDWAPPVVKQDKISWEPRSYEYEPAAPTIPKKRIVDVALAKAGNYVKKEFKSESKRQYPKLHKLYARARRVFGAVKPLAMAGYRAVKTFLTPPSAACGGKVTKTGVVKVHKGEMIVSAKHAKKAQRALADIAKRAKKSK